MFREVRILFMRWFVLAFLIFQCSLPIYSQSIRAKSLSLADQTNGNSITGKLDTDPFGNVDNVCLGSVSGWAYDPDAGTAAINVDIYINDSLVSRTLADRYRPDIPFADSRVQGDNHGFDILLPILPVGSYSVKVYAVNYPDGNNPQLSTTKTFTVSKGTVYLSNGILKVGINLDWGGAITEIIYNNANLVDRHDTGRLIQTSFYDGSYSVDPSNPNWGWNPVQAGNKYNAESSVFDYSVSDTMIYTKTQPLEWNPDNKGGGNQKAVLSSVYLEQWVSLSNNIINVKYRLKYFGTDNLTHIGSQEFPCLYLIPSLHRIITYDGVQPWEKDTFVEKAVPAFPSYLIFFTTEYWSSFVDDNNFGVTVFTNSKSPSFIATKITNSQTTYLNSSCSFDIPSNSVNENEIFLLVGEISSVRDQIYNLHLNHEPKISWEFNNDGDSEGWASWNDVSPLNISADVLKGITTGPDSYLVNWRGLDIDAKKYDKIEISMKANSATEASFYFTTVSDRNWGEGKSKHFMISAGNDFKTYSVSMSTLSTWVGKLLQLRFDPANAKNVNFEIEYIRIIPKSPTGINTLGEIQIPQKFVLYQNYPNPFNPETIIGYQLPISSHVSLKVYDLLGREIATLVNEFKTAGTYNLQFSIHNFQLSSGVYFYRLQTGSFSQAKKLLLLK